MSELPQRFDHVRRFSRMGRLCSMVGLVALAIVGLYLFFSGADSGFAKSWIGVAVLAGGLMILGVAMFIWGLVDVVLKAEATTHRLYDAVRDLCAASEQQNRHLQVIAENVQLSDTARAIAHRVKERTALRLAINEEIIKGDFEAAYALVEQLEARHGYRNEAARLRREVDLSHQQEDNHKLHEDVERVHARLAAQDWDAARREMDRLLSEHPENQEVRELPKLFSKRRGEHKRRLLKEWDESVQRNEVDRGIAILKELDQYLTANEAAALEESARGVFRAKLHNLGVAFSMALTEHNWPEALDVGRQIVEEFPNSRMAREVLERMEALEKRAAESAEQIAAAAAQG